MSFYLTIGTRCLLVAVTAVKSSANLDQAIASAIEDNKLMQIRSRIFSSYKKALQHKRERIYYLVTTFWELKRLALTGVSQDELEIAYENLSQAFFEVSIGTGSKYSCYLERKFGSIFYSAIIESIDTHGYINIDRIEATIQLPGYISQIDLADYALRIPNRIRRRKRLQNQENREEVIC